jgi:hypothetical protein
MNNRVVFLDFDGCIVTQSTLKNFPGYGHPDCVEALNYITDTSGAKIVISSTWRYEGLEDCREHLGRWGVTGDVIDITPLPHQAAANGIYIADSRGAEIQAWLDENKDVTQFVILDDDDDGMEPLVLHFIKTEFKYGLTMDHARIAVDILNG